MTDNPLLLFHAIAGSVGLVCGYLAIFLKKGSTRHLRAGNAFVVAMIAMGLSGALLAWFRPASISIMTGLLMVYLVTTAWLAARREEPHERLFNVCGLVLVSSLSVAYFVFAKRVDASPTGFIEGVLIPSSYYYFFGYLAAMFALGDLALLVRGGVQGPRVSGPWRIARHLWRMCFAMLLAASSLFQGNPQLFSENLRGTLWLQVPVLLVLAALLFWLCKVLLTKWYRAAHRVFANNVYRRRSDSPVSRVNDVQ